MKDEADRRKHEEHMRSWESVDYQKKLDHLTMLEELRLKHYAPRRTQTTLWSKLRDLFSDSAEGKRTYPIAATEDQLSIATERIRVLEAQLVCVQKQGEDKLTARDKAIQELEDKLRSGRTWERDTFPVEEIPCFLKKHTWFTEDCRAHMSKSRNEIFVFEHNECFFHVQKQQLALTVHTQWGKSHESAYVETMDDQTLLTEINQWNIQKTLGKAALRDNGVLLVFSLPFPASEAQTVECLRQIIRVAAIFEMEIFVGRRKVLESLGKLVQANLDKLNAEKSA